MSFTGTDGGFRLTAAAPATGSTSELTLYLGVEGGVVGNLSTNVFGVVGADEAFDISSSSNNSWVSFKYRGGPLDVRYTVAAGSRACDVPAEATRWCCVRPPAQTSSVSLALSGANVLDWVHYGNGDGDGGGDMFGEDREKGREGERKGERGRERERERAESTAVA